MKSSMLSQNSLYYLLFLKLLKISVLHLFLSLFFITVLVFSLKICFSAHPTVIKHQRDTPLLLFSSLSFCWAFLFRNMTLKHLYLKKRKQLESAHSIFSLINNQHFQKYLQQIKMCLFPQATLRRVNENCDEAHYTSFNDS